MVKVIDLKDGMKEIDIVVEIDYIPPRFQGKEWGVIYVKDDTKDIKMILQGKDMKSAKEGMKIKITNGSVVFNRNELQLLANKENPIEFISNK